MQVHRFEWRANPRPVPDGRMIAAVGDVHGCAALYETLLQAIAADVEAVAPDGVLAIQVGDLIDRGPHSQACLELAAAGLGAFLGPNTAVEDVTLLGNHDAWLKMALDGALDQVDVRVWGDNGGIATWRDFGLENFGTAAELAAQIRESLPDRLQHFVRTMALQRQVGALMFVHAGLDPRRPLDNQGPETWLWIRDPFLTPAKWPFDLLVVHGHTIELPNGEPAVHAHRIGIDTGAFHSGVLTAVEFHGDQLRFVQASYA